MTKHSVKPVRALKSPDGTLSPMALGTIVDAFEAEGSLFPTEAQALAHLAHIPLRKRLSLAMFQVLVAAKWYGEDDEDTIADAAEDLAFAMLGVDEQRNEVRDEIIAVLECDRELYK